MKQSDSKPLFKAHPWHGISSGPQAPVICNSFIEIVPTDVIKYEIDKESGHLKVDRPQKYSSQCPTLYGFIPQTYCGDRVGALAASKTGRKVIKGDGDPLDICVLAERPIVHGDLLLESRPIGGLRLIDRDEADDKILAILHNDGVYGGWTDVAQCPASFIDRLSHYFLTYKQMPGEVHRKVEIAQVYGADEAHAVIRASMEDYRVTFA